MTTNVLSPAPADLRLASTLAQRLVAVGQGRIRRVVMIGSRARGTPHLRSDLDLVVLVETPDAARRWGAAEHTSERERLQREAGPPPVRTDLSVRCTDRYEEARRVIGGVEQLIDLEGIEVYSEPWQRAARARCSFDQVRREHTLGWVQDATDTLDRAIEVEHRRVRAEPFAGQQNRFSTLALARATNALLVWHQIFGSKADGAQGHAAKLEEADPETATELREMLSQAAPCPRAAHAVLSLAVRRLSDDPRMRASLQPVQKRLWAQRGILAVEPNHHLVISKR